MSQMNKGLTGVGKTGPVAGKPLTAKAQGTFQPAVNTARVAKGNVTQAKQNIKDAKQEKVNQNAKFDRAQKLVKSGGDKFIAGMNMQSAMMGIDKANKKIGDNKATIKSNTPKGPVIGARTGQNTLQGVGKTGPKQGAPLTSNAVGGAKTVTPFKQASPSNPMGRTGGKPGVNIGTSKF